VIVLADNDVILKLVQCDLIAEFLSSFDVTLDDIRIRPVTRLFLSKNKIRKRLDPACIARLEGLLSAVCDINLDPDPDELSTLVEIAKIDEGEAVLFIVCPQYPDARIVTGDKRSLVGLHDAEKVWPVCKLLAAKLAGKIYCFEQVLLKILDAVGFEAIRDRIVLGRECDKGLALWLGSGLEATETEFRNGLASFLNEVKQVTGGLLA